MDYHLLFDYVEGNLSGIEKLDMEKAISGDPLLKEEIEQLMDCKLSAPQNMTFPVNTLIQKHWLWSSLSLKFVLLGLTSAIAVGVVISLLFQNEQDNVPSRKAVTISNNADITSDEKAIPKEAAQETEIEIIQPEQEKTKLIRHEENGKRSAHHTANPTQSFFRDPPKELPHNMMESVNIHEPQATKILNETGGVVQQVNVLAEGDPKISRKNKDTIQQAVDINNTIPLNGKKVSKKKLKLKWSESVISTDDF